MLHYLNYQYRIIILAHVAITYAFMREGMPIIDARDTNVNVGRICVNQYNETSDVDINFVLLICDAITLHMLINKLVSTSPNSRRSVTTTSGHTYRSDALYHGSSDALKYDGSECPFPQNSHRFIAESLQKEEVEMLTQIRKFCSPDLSNIINQS